MSALLASQLPWEPRRRFRPSEPCECGSCRACRTRGLAGAMSGESADDVLEREERVRERERLFREAL